jgi:hypothetical protein
VKSLNPVNLQKALFSIIKLTPVVPWQRRSFLCNYNMALTKVRTQFRRWLLAENHPESTAHEKTHPWWQVMCLTGVDYFSTLGYQPGIAALAAGSLAPIATLVLVLLTLFGALPIYRRVAMVSPHGEGSISMLAQLLPWWQGKLFVLCLLGFAATDFVITITLSAADAAVHIIQNPFVRPWLEGKSLGIGITMLLIAMLGGVFLKGFKEAIGIAVLLVIVYLSLNFVTIGTCFLQIVKDPALITNWQESIFTKHGSILNIVGMAVLIFPRLALGLSGFETGVVLMPLVKGHANDDEHTPMGRIQNTYKLLTLAALIMSFYLLTSSFVTTLLIPADAFKEGGAAYGAALSYLSHKFLGDIFGTAYDITTIAILWFAGASAMAGLLNIVPRYLPRYGMAPDWARATRPLVLLFSLIAFIVTLVFKADVEAQGGAYATGVLVLMSSAAFAVALAVRKARPQNPRKFLMFGLITLVFIYTTIDIVREKPEGIKIAAFFIGSIVITSLFSRVMRSTELRVETVEMDPEARNFIDADTRQGKVRIIANRRQAGDEEEYRMKEQEVREDNHIPDRDKVLFLEIQISDASQFTETIRVEGQQVGKYRILRAKGAAVPNTIAAILLYIRDHSENGQLPHAYFGWVEGNPIQYLMRFLLFGEGDTAVVTREVLRRAETDPNRRPGIHVGG